MKNKWILLLCLFAQMSIPGYGRATDDPGAFFGNKNEVRYTPYNYNNPYKRNARICLIGGTVLCGCGTLVVLYSAVLISGASERDPVKFQEIRNERRTGMIVGGSMIAASIPLFVLGKYYHGKYSNQPRRRISLQLQSGSGYDYKGNTASSVGVGFSWYF